MKNEFETMTAVEVAEAIYDCACENARECEETPYHSNGCKDPRNTYIEKLYCEDEKLELGEHLTLLINGNFTAEDNPKCTFIAASVYDADTDGYDRYAAYRDAIQYELKNIANCRNVRIDY